MTFKKEVIFIVKRQRGFFRGLALAAKYRLSGGSSSVQYRHEPDEGDELFYNKVCAILNTMPNCNPLAGILDREYMMTLHGAERERYVFTLSDQVQRCVRRFEQERECEQAKIAR